MEAAKGIPKWVWVSSCGLFLVAAVAFQRIAALADAWFAGLGAFAFTGILLDLFMIFMAAWLSATLFLRKFGYDAEVRRRLGFAYVLTFLIWTAFSFLLVANLMKFAPVLLGLSLFTLAEAVIGSIAIYAAVLLRGRLFQRNVSRRAVAAGVS